MKKFLEMSSIVVIAALTMFSGLVSTTASASIRPSDANALFATQVVNRITNMCLDVPGGSTDNKKGIQQYYCNGGTNQQWEYTPSQYAGYGKFKNVASGKCLDVRDTSTSIGARIQQYTCMDVPNQLWSYEPGPGFLRALHSGLCAAAENLQYKADIAQYPCGNSNYLVFPTWSASI